MNRHRGSPLGVAALSQTRVAPLVCLDSSPAAEAASSDRRFAGAPACGVEPAVTAPGAITAASSFRICAAPAVVVGIGRLGVGRVCIAPTCANGYRKPLNDAALTLALSGIHPVVD